MRIEIERLSRLYGDIRAVDDLSLTIFDGELLVLLGPSGCGKTTTMRSIVGLETPTSGRIVVGGNAVFDSGRGINVPPNRRQMGMVFQSYAIWPHKTVFENVSFPLERRGESRAAIDARVRKVLALVGLEAMAERGASMLSGGQMQRVAFARSIVAEPRVLLLDEPLSNLDAKLREHLRFELRDLQQRLGITTVYVTHDQSEALALADRIAVMRHGRIIQLDSPSGLYRSPANTFVADFLGVSNIAAATVTGAVSNGVCSVALKQGGERLLAAVSASVEGNVSVCIRPEHLTLGKRGALSNGAAATVLPATVKVASFLGSTIRYLLACDSGLELEAMSTDTDMLLSAGEVVDVRVEAVHAQLLPDTL